MQLPPERKVGSKKLLPGNSSIKANFFEVPVLANFLKNTASACKTKYNSIRLKALSKELWNFVWSHSIYVSVSEMLQASCLLSKEGLKPGFVCLIRLYMDKLLLIFHFMFSIL